MSRFEDDVSVAFADMDYQQAEITRLADRLPASDPAKRAFGALRDGADVPDELVDHLLGIVQNPSSRKWRQRVVATWALGRLVHHGEGAGRTSVRLQAMVGKYHDRDTAGRAFRAYCRTTFGLLPLTLLLWQLGITGVWLPALLISGCLPFAYPFYFLSSELDKRRVNEIRAEAVASLGLLGDPNTISSIASAALERNGRVRRRAVEALKRVLPTLRDEHYGQLPSETVPLLLRLLSSKDDELVVAVIRALGVVAGGNAVPHLGRLASRCRAVVEAAKEALPPLLRRQEIERDAARLLRASEAGADLETLLRPVSHSGAGDPAILLRAGVADPEENR